MSWSAFISHFSQIELALIVVNLLLLVFAHPVLGWIFPEQKESSDFTGKLRILRGTALLVLIYVLINGVLRPISSDPWITRFLAVLLIIYLAYLFFFAIGHVIRRRFGKQRQVNDADVQVETYNSRVLSLGVGVVISILALIVIIQVLGFDSWLEATGIVGIIGIMLAMTQAAWAPDLISGLVIMNSRLVEEGNVVEAGDGDKKFIGVVFRTKLFYTEILHLANNHRIMIQNSRLRALTLHNLSRFASAKGLREAVSVNVSYDIAEDQMQKLFSEVRGRAIQDSSIPVEEQYEAEIRATSSGDYAVKWTYFYYTKDARHVLKTRQLMLALVLDVARDQGVVLATPDLYQQVVQAELRIQDNVV